MLTTQTYWKILHKWIYVKLEVTVMHRDKQAYVLPHNFTNSIAKHFIKSEYQERPLSRTPP